MYADRQTLYQKLEQELDSRVLLYVTGDRRNLETQIHQEVIGFFVDHLDLIGPNTPQISLVLHTSGGNTLAAWSLVNLIRQFCDQFQVVIPEKAHSAGTLIALGANSIVMTKQATLGPIDPSVNTPLNPEVSGAPPQVKAPVSVENVNGFLEFARASLGESDRFPDVFLRLANAVHPLVLGKAFRARTQIRMLAKKLLDKSECPVEHQDRILNFVCSEAGSHDYTINRREAQDELALPIRKPTQQQYEIIRDIFKDVSRELELSTPFEPRVILGANATANYDLPRALIESVEGGSHSFRSQGQFRQHQIQTPGGLPQVAIQDNRHFEGWKYAPAEQ